MRLLCLLKRYEHRSIVLMGVYCALRRVVLPALLLFSGMHASAMDDPAPVDDPAPASADLAGDEAGSVQWGPLFKESLFFLGVEHAFRVSTDPGVRAALNGSFFTGYVDSVENLHGWADGDPFLVNYVGHPIQGAVSGYIWIHNDLRYRTAEIGRNRRYWTGRLRATAYAWAYSEEFEIGPISEASIGHSQAHFPQQGFVDQVITPVIGGVWMIGEDAIDRFVIKPIEAHTRSPWLKIVARGFLNPSRTFANCMELELPWYRETRSGVFGKNSLAKDVPPRKWAAAKSDPPPADPPEVPGVSPFEFALSFNQMLLGAGNRNVACAGGGGTALFNLNSVVGIEADVAGCKMLGLEANLSGDALTFAAGPRFSYRNSSRWTPWVNVLLGGEKLTQEAFYPAEKAIVKATAPPGTSPFALHSLYTQDYSTAGFALSMGGGVDWALNRVVAFRVGNLEYSHAWLHDLNGESYPNELRLTTGVVLRLD
jgi:hypothetical protein